MAFTYKPPFAQTPKVSSVVLSAANISRDGSGTISTVFTAGADGAIVKRIKAIPSQASAAATSAKVVCIFISIDSGSTWRFYTEGTMPTVTPGTAATGEAGTRLFSYPDGLVLPAAALIGATITVYGGVQDATTVIAEGTDF